ncbi:MAG: EamA family transporter [Sphingomicrobium sp.]
MSAAPRSDFRAVLIPFIIYTAIWGGTWLVIRDQIGTVPPQWSVAYRFILAAFAMALVALARGERLAIGRKAWPAILFLGTFQFSINFNAVYLAERFITSGVVATMFALLLVPSSLLGWAMLGQRPTRRFAAGSAVAIAGVALLLSHELADSRYTSEQVFAGVGFTVLGMLGASAANVFSARPQIQHLPVFSLLAWSMTAGAALDVALAFAVAGPPVIDWSPRYWVGLFYLSIFASVVAFSLYYPVVRRIGPAKAAYSSMIVPIVAMALSTMFEGYRWTLTTVGGVALVLAGMALALGRGRPKIAPAEAG